MTRAFLDRSPLLRLRQFSKFFWMRGDIGEQQIREIVWVRKERGIQSSKFVECLVGKVRCA